MAGTLSEISDALAETVAVVGKSVVRVEGRGRLPASGFAWSDGVIVTAHHVLERDEKIKIGLPDGTTVEATLAGRDPTTDLAVLRVSADGLAPVATTEPDAVRVGNIVLALGRPVVISLKAVRISSGIVFALSITVFHLHRGWNRPFWSSSVSEKWPRPATEMSLVMARMGMEDSLASTTPGRM